jgi:plasmid stabilization system protein ParE
MTMAKRWTKKAIREMQSQIDSFVLVREMYAKREDLRAALERNGARRAVVLSGLRSWIAMLTERAKQEREAHEAWLRLNAPEVAERMKRIAEDNEKAIVYVRKLIERIDAEGLPEEVETYVPMRIAA